MAATSIEWTMKVWNPTTGCNKVSQGCKNCYAEIMHRRLRVMQPEKYSRPFLDGAFLHFPSLQVPSKIKKPTTFFVNSMSDLFHEKLRVIDIASVYAIMAINPQHTFQVLTKRPERRQELLSKTEFVEMVAMAALALRGPQKLFAGETNIFKCDWPLKNVWEGTSVEDQKTASERIPHLLKTPAAVRWLSMEPLLSHVDLNHIYTQCLLEGLDLDAGMQWIVVGGESGNKKRPFEASWARAIRDYCKESLKIKFFMKQMDKKQAIPKDLFIRQYPKIKK